MMATDVARKIATRTMVFASLWIELDGTKVTNLLPRRSRVLVSGALTARAQPVRNANVTLCMAGVNRKHQDGWTR